MITLKNKVVVVTGACGILGSCMVKQFRDFGAKVIGVDLPQYTEKLRADPAYEGIVFLDLDLSNMEDIQRFCSEMIDSYGVPDCLVNNAASKGNDIASFMKRAADMSPETWQEVFSVNVEGTFFLTQQLGVKMVERGAGSIVFIGSIYGEMAPDPRIYEGSLYLGQEIASPPVYSASKAAVSGLSRYLATDWGKENIRVNCVCPGGVSSGQNEEFETRYSNRVPLGRMAQPEEITFPVAFLLSDHASYITGQTLMVDGGLSAW